MWRRQGKGLIMQPQKNLDGAAESSKSKVDGISHNAIAWIDSEIDAVAELGTKSLEEVKNLARKTSDEVSSRFFASGRKSIEFIKKNPVLCLGVAVATGYLIARVMRSRRGHAGTQP